MLKQIIIISLIFFVLAQNLILKWHNLLKNNKTLMEGNFSIFKKKTESGMRKKRNVKKRSDKWKPIFNIISSYLLSLKL